MAPNLREKLFMTALGWLAAGLIFFPIFWMVLTSFKTEIEAVQTPPSLFFHPTLENYVEVQERADYFRFAMNSILISFGSTLLALVLAVPAAYAMAFFPGKRTKDLLLWMLSTKMLPPVGVLVPIYLIFRDLNLLDTRIGLIDRLCAGQPADRGLDAVHLLQGGAQGHPRGRPHGRRQAQAGADPHPDAAVAAGDRLDRPAGGHPAPGTRRSGAST